MSDLTIPPVVTSIEVARPPEEAFDVFVRSMGRWWNPSHSLLKSPQADVVIEPRAGGRWYERGADGSTAEWGRVLAWDPPSRLTLAWQLDGSWTYDPNLLTEVDVAFEPSGAGTRVTLAHSKIERMGASARAAREGLGSPGGWSGLLRRYAGVAGGPVEIWASYGHPPVLQGAVRDIRAIWAAEEAGAPYELRWVATWDGEQRGEAYRALNPFGKIPAMRHAGLTLFESGAIVTYLGDRFGALTPSPLSPDRALYDQWSFAALNTIEPALMEVFEADVFGDGSETAREARAQSAEVAASRLAAFDAALGDRPYILGAAFSGADILLAQVLGFARDEALFAAAPRALAYRERMRARPAYVRAAAIQGRGPA